jgi:hypothetical protein
MGFLVFGAHMVAVRWAAAVLVYKYKTASLGESPSQRNTKLKI